MENNKRPEEMARINTAELAQAFIDEQVAEIQKQVGDKKVLLALSGGVDSSVVAALLIKAIGRQLVCVHVNHGLLRKGEPEQVVEVFRNQMDANLVYVDAVDRFLDKLAGVAEPESSAQSSFVCLKKRQENRRVSNSSHRAQSIPISLKATALKRIIMSADFPKICSLSLSSRLNFSIKTRFV